MKQSQQLGLSIAVFALIATACSQGTIAEPTSAAAATTTAPAIPAISSAAPTTIATPEVLEPCIPSGDHASIQNELTEPGSKAVLCPGAIFELGDTVFFTADNQQIYTRGLPTDDSRAMLRVSSGDQGTAVSGGHFDRAALRNVIIDGNRPQLGLGEGALIDFGRGIEGIPVEDQLVEWVRAYDPRGWTVLYFGGGCDGAEARHNDFGPAGLAEYAFADGISVECPNSIIENNTIVDATDGGIVIFQSPGSVVANNTIRAENRIMFYGISMEDYHPREGDFTATRVTGNIIDAAGSLIRRGIAMGPLVGCIPEQEWISRSRGAVVTANTLMGNHMGYGFVISGVEDWTATGNVDLSTHPVPEREVNCFDDVADHPGGFQINPNTSSGVFQEEFEPTTMAFTKEFWTFQPQVSTDCLRELIGADVLNEIKSGNQGQLWPALEAVPNGERIGQCISLYEPPDISDLSARVDVTLLPCKPFCVSLELSNQSEDTAPLDEVQFMLEDFPVECAGIPESLGSGQTASCTITDYVTPGFQVIRWHGLPPDSGQLGFNYPMDAEE